MRFPPQPDAVRRARTTARDLLTVAGFRRLDDVLLVVSELVTNAVRHARTDLELVLEADESRVLVEVHDDLPDAPAVIDADPWAVSGRGLRLVESISDRWGADVVPGDGKRVWCEIGAAS